MMWQSLKVGAAIVAVVGLVMSGLAVAHAVDNSDLEPAGAEQVIDEALAPLLADGTLSREQADAVVAELAPLIARVRFHDQTQELVKRLGRLAAETAEVLGITPDDLGDQLEAGLTLAAIAQAHGFTSDDLVDRVTDHVAAHLAVQVTAGKLDQARADEIVASTERALGELVDVEHPFGTVLRERRSHAVRVVGLSAAADAVGLPIDEVRAQLEQGSSLAQIATAQGVGEDDLIQAIVAPLAQRLDKAVERGRLTEEEAAAALTKANDRAAAAIHKVPGS